MSTPVLTIDPVVLVVGTPTAPGTADGQELTDQLFGREIQVADERELEETPEPP